MFLFFYYRNYKDDGRFFYQYALASDYVTGTYVFKTSSDDYYTFYYSINGAFDDNPNIGLKSKNNDLIHIYNNRFIFHLIIKGYNVKNSDNFSFNIQNKPYFRKDLKLVDFCIKSTGVLISIKKLN